jgi:homoserine kinase
VELDVSATFRICLPATSANLGAAFDCGAIALSLHLTVEAAANEGFSILASGRNVDQCGRLDGNLILDTYRSLLQREGRPVVPLALAMENEIPLGMGCGSSAAGRLAAITLADHFGELGWNSERILEEASQLEGHPDNAAACWLGGMVVAACEGRAVHVARVKPPQAWRAMIVLPSDPVATSHARAVLPNQYSREDCVANIQAASLLGLAFAAGRGELLRVAMADRIHQPYRAKICPLLPALLPLAGNGGILGVALSGAGPSALLVLSSEDVVADSTRRVLEALGEGSDGEGSEVEIVTVAFEDRGARDARENAPFGVS